eukprot:180331-Prymnesium_polylepis.1
MRWVHAHGRGSAGPQHVNVVIVIVRSSEAYQQWLLRDWRQRRPRCLPVLGVPRSHTQRPRSSSACFIRTPPCCGLGWHADGKRCARKLRDRRSMPTPLKKEFETAENVTRHSFARVGLFAISSG